MQKRVGWVAVDGELRPIQDESEDERADEGVGALEAGASVGWGVFSTGAIVGARPILLACHIERLRRDAQSTCIPNLGGAGLWSGWSESLRRVIEANRVEEGMFRLTLCARGEGRWHPDGAPRAIVAAQAASLEVAPARVWMSPFHIDARAPLRGVKSTSYAPWHIMALQARERGCDEALYCDATGILCEGAHSNLFWRRGNVIFTPALDTGCLPGIARAQILEWLRAGSKWRVKEGRAGISHLMQADEVLLSSSTLGPRAVASVQDNQSALWQDDGKGKGKGEVCAHLRSLWQRMMQAASTSARTSSTPST